MLNCRYFKHERFPFASENQSNAPESKVNGLWRFSSSAAPNLFHFFTATRIRWSCKHASTSRRQQCPLFVCVTVHPFSRGEQNSKGEKLFWIITARVNGISFALVFIFLRLQPACRHSYRICCKLWVKLLPQPPLTEPLSRSWTPRAQGQKCPTVSRRPYRGTAKGKWENVIWFSYTNWRKWCLFRGIVLAEIIGL